MGWVIRCENSMFLEFLKSDKPIYLRDRIQDSIVMTSNKSEAHHYATQWELQNELCYLNFLAGKGSYVAEPVLRIIK